MNNDNKNYFVFREVNHWWITGSVRSELLEKVERDCLLDIYDSLGENQITLIEGPRRIGKTSLFYQLIQKLLQDNVNPRHIIFLSLDDPLLEKDTIFQDLISFLEINLLGSPLLQSNIRFYIFLDEVTKLETWELWLKRYYDLKYPFKFIVSSSSVAFLEARAHDSLAGRVISFQILPLTFVEYLKFKEFHPEVINIFSQLNPIRLWHLAMKEEYSQLKGIYNQLSLYMNDIEIIISNYLK